MLSIIENFKLYPYQKLAIKFAKTYKKAFIEAPTGSGKSVMISRLANEYAKEGKKVIVSTYTNQLVIDLYDKISHKNKDIVVGKDNYLNVNALDMSVFTDLGINAKDVIDVLSKMKKINSNADILLDLFVENLNADFETKDLLLKILKAKNKRNQTDLKINDLGDVDIAVTNHYYLFLKTLFTKTDFSDCVVILDETHTLSDVAENIFTYNFSLFRFRYLLKKTIDYIKFLEFRGQKSLYKGLNRLYLITDDLFKSFTKENLAGLSFIDDPKMNRVIEKIKNRLLKEEKTIQKLIEKNLTDKDFIIKTFLEEWGELKEISTQNVNETAIAFSSAKGYPSLSALKGDYYAKLGVFWKKLPVFKGFSATLTIPNDKTYYSKRLNVKDVNFYQITPVFSKKQINYYLADKDFPKPETTENSVNIEWIKAVGDYILKTFEGKNSLILTGGFLEVDNLYEYLKAKSDVNVIKAEKHKSVYSVIERFKKEGGILIGTRNYGTGIDLKGERLEKLYIAKLPYPVLGNKKWIELKKEDRLKGTSLSYFLAINEMLLNLKQWIGRLIRDKNDRGDLYILDSRVNNGNVKDKVIRVIEESYL